MAWTLRSLSSAALSYIERNGAETASGITVVQIADLNDSYIRTLVIRLALAESHAQGCPSSPVTAGGNLYAADGG